jgi:hypothetical protein
MKNQLNIFQENFPLIKCMVYEDCIVYKVLRGRCKEVAEEANKVIERLGLNLSAIPTSLSSQDSVCVQSNEIGYV